jgi:diacylglycerol kinase (ATP)
VRIGLLTNLRAGGRGARSTRVLSYVKERGGVEHVETHDGEGAPQALAELARQGVEVLVVNGGDGTLAHTLTLLLEPGSPFERRPLVAALRSGRTSMSALDIGSRRDPVSALELIMRRNEERTLAASIVERPVLRVTLEPDGIVACGMFLGVGLIHRAIMLTHRVFPRGRAQGVFGSGIVTGTLVARAAMGKIGDVLTPDDVDVMLDGQMLDGVPPGTLGAGGAAMDPKRYQLLIMTTLGRLFLKIRPFWGSESAPVRFTAMRPGEGHSPAAILRILAGRSPRNGKPDPRYTSRNVKRVDLTMDCGMTIDGELFEPLRGRHVSVEAHENVRFVESR